MKSVTRRQFFTSATLAAAASRAGAQGKSKVTLAGADYLRFTPIANGDVTSEEIELDWIRGPRNEMLGRAASDPSIDGGEASMLGHLLRIDQGDRSLVAIPVFPLRNFTARDIYKRKDSPLTARDLEGRRVGIYNWAASGAVWYRQFVRYCAQDTKKMQWVVGGIDEPSQVTHRAPLPPYVADAPLDKSLSELLLEGSIDAMFAPLPPKRYHAHDGPIARLIPEYRSVESRYFEEMACYPTQHVIVIRRATWQRIRSLGTHLVDLFQTCESTFMDGLRLFPYATPWMGAEVEQTDLLMGPEFHAHGLEENRHVVDVFCQSAFEDGLTERRVTVDDYFSEFLKG